MAISFQDPEADVFESPSASPSPPPAPTLAHAQIASEPAPTVTDEDASSTPSTPSSPAPIVFPSFVLDDICPPAPLVYINGFPASGKSTVAMHLKDILYKPGPPTVIITDYHMLHYRVPVETTDEQYDIHLTAIRQDTLDLYLRDPENDTTTFVFIDSHIDDRFGRCVSDEYKAAAHAVGRPFIPVYLHCERNEHLRRVNTPERRFWGYGKTLDKTRVARLRDQHRLFTWHNEGLDIDVTSISPRTAAGLILREMNRPTLPIGWRYAE